MTRGVFDEIAGQWAEYRVKPLPILAVFFERMPSGAIALDAGCGSGRNAKAIAEKTAKVYGIDLSEKMVGLARGLVKAENAEFSVGDIVRLPFADGFFDAAFYLASLHHLEPEEHALAFGEMFRVLKTGGRAFITVWNKSQKRFSKVDGKSTLVGWNAPSGRRVGRYYYFFGQEELRALAEAAGFKVADLFFETRGECVPREGSQNICLILQK